MKELSIEERAQRYDEALERAVNIRTGKCETTFIFTEGLFNYLFPELEECNEEEVREAMIDFFKHEREEGVVVSHYGVNIERMIAWLEKQGQTFTKKDVDDAWLKGMCDAKHELEKQDKKPADKVKPKFKVGDWVVVDGITQKVTHIQAEGFDTDRAWNGKSTFKDVHLWTIADVKDGNVLVDVYGNIGIYKSHDDFSWLSYCSLGYYGGFQYFTIEHDNEKTYPATKEQQDTLFAKMREAGYEWDAEKRELKKISQRMISAEAKEAMYGKSTAWSEEDEEIYSRICHLIHSAAFENYDVDEVGKELGEYAKITDWLKAIKTRCAWKPNEEQIDALEQFISEYKDIDDNSRAYPISHNIESLYNDLKKLTE